MHCDGLNLTILRAWSGAVRGIQTVPRAELEGALRSTRLLRLLVAKWAERIREGGGQVQDNGGGRLASSRSSQPGRALVLEVRPPDDHHVTKSYIDATYVTKTWRHRGDRVGTNAGLWKELDHELEDLEALDWYVQPMKIKARQDRRGYEEGQDAASLFANAAADRLADNAAERLQLDAGLEASLARTDACAKQVLCRIATIEQTIMEALPREAKKAKERRATDLRDSWIGRLRLSHHSLAWNGRRFACRRCKVCREPSRLWHWLRQGECPGRPAHYRTAILIEAPRWAESRRTQAIVENVVPLLSTLDELSGTESEPEWDGDRPLAPKKDFHHIHSVQAYGAWNWCSKYGSFSRGLRPTLLVRPCNP